jgi:hypothetical protein
MDNEEKGILEGVGSSLGIVLLGVGMFLLYKNKDNLPSGIGEIPTTFITFVANMMPFALLAYGIAGDVVNQEGPRLSIPSITAVASILVIGIGSQMFATSQGADLSAQDSSGLMWCTIPGLEGVESPYFPTAFMSTAIIGFYYLCWSWHTGRPWTPTLLAFGIVWIAQFATFIFGECQLSYKPLFGSVLFNILISTVFGIIFGAIAFASSFSNPRLSPYNIPSGPPAASGGPAPATLSKCPDGSVPIDGKCPYKPSSLSSQQVQDTENTFVAELYKNGQLVTDSISS